MKFRAEKDGCFVYAESPKDIGEMFLLYSDGKCTEPVLWTGYNDMHGNEIYFGDVVRRKKLQDDSYPGGGMGGARECSKTKEWEIYQIGKINSPEGFRFSDEYIFQILTKTQVKKKRYACNDYDYEIMKKGTKLTWDGGRVPKETKKKKD